MRNVLRDKDFRGLDLSGLSLRQLVFSKCLFDRANLERCDFANTKFFQCSFERASFERSALSEATFSCEAFDKTFEKDGKTSDISEVGQFIKLFKGNNNLPNKIIYKDEFFKKIWKKIIIPGNKPRSVIECNGVKTSFRRANLSDSKFNGYELLDCDFSDANLAGASFKQCALSHSLFSGTFFKKNEVNIFGDGCSLDFANFRGTNLDGISFRRCKTLEAADFSDADLRNAKFHGSNKFPMVLYRANFNNVCLKNAEFKDCDMKAATFVRSDLSGVLFDGTEKSTNAIAADFTGANLQGAVIKEGLNFTSSNFSGAYLSWLQSTEEEPENNEPENGIYRATEFNSNVNLCDSIFFGAYLRGTELDSVNVTNANFAGATFGGTSGKREFKNTTFINVDFRDVDLSGYTFINCELSNASFEGSNLDGAEFINPKSLEHAQFVRAKLNGTKFKKSAPDANGLINMQACGFENSDLAMAIFHDCNLEWAWFNESNLKDCKFSGCDLQSVAFKGVEFSGMKIEQVKRADHCLFKSSKGKSADFDLSLTDLNCNDPHYAVVFVDTIFKDGCLHGCFLGATLDHSKLVLTNDNDRQNSKIEWWQSEFKTSSIDFKGEMNIEAGLVDNSKISIIDNSKNRENTSLLKVKDSEIRSSAIKGLNSQCEFTTTAFYSSSLSGEVRNIRAEKCLFEATTFGETSNRTLNEWPPKKLNDIPKYCPETLGSIKSNYKGIGDYVHEDLFFGFENDKYIEKFENKGWKAICIGALSTLAFFSAPLMYYLELSVSGWEKNLAQVFYSLFLSFSLSSIFTLSIMRLVCKNTDYKNGDKKFNNIVSAVGILSVILFIPVFYILPRGASPNEVLYISAISSLAASILMFSSAQRNFLKHLFNYGIGLKKFTVWVGLVLSGFSISYYCLFSASTCNVKNLCTRFVQNNIFNSIHTSANAFFALGFWGNVQPEGYPIRMYINIESAIGVIMMAVLVAIIIRKTMGR